jgi:hypothetical protein
MKMLWFTLWYMRWGRNSKNIGISYFYKSVCQLFLDPRFKLGFLQFHLGQGFGDYSSSTYFPKYKRHSKICMMNISHNGVTWSLSTQSQ